MLKVQPGDVLAVRTPDFFGTAVRFVAALAGKPNLSNHIAVAHHYDKHGTFWVIEGRPSGVGWRTANDYLASRWTITNANQPKTDVQRAGVCKAMEALIGTEYDWEAIAADAADDLFLKDLWRPNWHGTVPGHIVCSAAATYAYDKNSLKRPPGNARTDQPCDWDTFILTQAWNK
jgi:hypothetical protein